MATFAELLRTLREEAGISQRELSRRSDINPAIVSRFEAGLRGPSGPEQVLALARALSLDPDQADLLMSASGFWPKAIVALGPRDGALLSVARVLTNPKVGPAARERFRALLAVLAEQWLAEQAGEPDSAP
ncbi:MAG: helix-turn-helix domain-containing protein [Chloroflexota bacterium]